MGNTLEGADDVMLWKDVPPELKVPWKRWEYHYTQTSYYTEKVKERALRRYWEPECQMAVQTWFVNKKYTPCLQPVAPGESFCYLHGGNARKKGKLTRPCGWTPQPPVYNFEELPGWILYPLARQRINTWEQVSAMSDEALLVIPGFGVKKLAALRSLAPPAVRPSPEFYAEEMEWES